MVGFLPSTITQDQFDLVSCATSTLKESKSQSTVQFLPITDLSQSSETCIYSTLLFIIGQARKVGVEIPCVTFDQPLWLKAMGIIKEEQLPIVCRLGGFHTLMSFLGSVAMLMKGSGIEDLFAEVYAENSIPHIMSGKAIAISLRAHLSLQSALMALLIQNLKDEEDTFGFEEIEKFHTNILEAAHDDFSFENLVASEAFCNVTDKLEELKAKLVKQSRTLKLWLFYIDYIDAVKLFIFAERTSNWELHLFAITKMLIYSRQLAIYITQKCSPICPADAEVTADTSLVVPPIRNQAAYSKENSKKLHWTLDISCNRANTHGFNKVLWRFDRGTGNDRECLPPLGIEYVLYRKYSRGND